MSELHNHSLIPSCTLAPWFIPHPDGCIGPRVDAILLCLSPVLRLHPRYPCHMYANIYFIDIGLHMSSDNVHPVFPSVDHPCFLLYPLSSHCRPIAWRGILEFSILNTCPSYLCLFFFNDDWWALISATQSSFWSLHFSLSSFSLILVLNITKLITVAYIFSSLQDVCFWKHLSG